MDLPAESDFKSELFDLYKCAVDGDTDAANRLFALLEPHLRAFLLSNLKRNTASISDLIMTTQRRLWIAIQNRPIDDHGHLLHLWLKIVKEKLKDYHRKKSREQKRFEQVPIEMAAIFWDELGRTFDGLTEDQRQIGELLVQGYNLQEISRALNLSYDKVRREAKLIGAKLQQAVKPSP